MRQVGRREVARQFQRGNLVEAQRMARIYDIRKGDFLTALDRFDRDVIIFNQQRQLLGQIIGENRRLGDADRIITLGY